MLGNDIANQLVNRLADLRAAESVDSIAAILPDLTLEAGIGYSTALQDRFRLYFCANHEYRQMSTKAGEQLQDVTRIKILKIGGG